MGADILLIGLGETGASLGLALGRSGGDFRRIGYDPSHDVARQAHKAGAVDRLTSDPRREAAGADLVLYNLPPSTLELPLEAIASDLKSDAILIHTTPLKGTALKTIQEQLPAGAAIVGAMPILGPERVFQPGTPQVDADRFQGGHLALVLPPGTPAAVVDVVSDLARLLGAHPFFLEAAELDAATTASEALPVLLAAAYLRSVAANPAWRDQGRLAARTFEGFTRLTTLRPATELAQDLAADRPNVLRWIDALIDELTALRGLVAQANADDLSQPFEEAASSYQAWKVHRLQDSGESTVPSHDIKRNTSLASLLGLRRPAPPR